MCPAPCPEHREDGESETMDVVVEAEEDDGDDGMRFRSVEQADGSLYVYYTDEFYYSMHERIFGPLLYMYESAQMVRPSPLTQIITCACALMVPGNDFIYMGGHICVHEDCQRNIMELSKLVRRAAIRARESEGMEAQAYILKMMFFVLAFANHFLPDDDLDRRDLPTMLQFIADRLGADPTPNCLRSIYAHHHDKLRFFGDPDGLLHAPETAPARVLRTQ